MSDDKVLSITYPLGNGTQYQQATQSTIIQLHVLSSSSELIVVPSGCGPGSLTDAYGLFIQAILAFLAFTSLIIKRFCEPRGERRPWIVWYFDTSKQAAGAAVIHFLNVFLASMFRGDPCTWYIVSYLLDSSVGLLIIYVCVKLVNCIATYKRYTTLKFGEYGTPPHCKPWFHQCMAFIGITVLEKLIITIVVQFPFWRHVRELILKPITNAKIEVTLVMLVIPFVVNTVMFWAVDNFTMRKGGVKFRTNGVGKYEENLKINDGSQERLLDAEDGLLTGEKLSAAAPRLKQRLSSSSIS